MTKKLLLMLLALTILSCASKKDILYFQDIKKSDQSAIQYMPNEVQINDILYIKISALVDESAQPFNIFNNSSTSNGFNVETIKIQGYLVSQEGSIVFPILGTIKVAGKSTDEVQKFISDILNDKGYLKDPIVSVRIINSKVTVLGEVNNPGTYSFDEQNISLNQAIGYAGDLTINGIRKDVLLIREVNGTRTYVRLDLTSADWFNSPYYYVKQNDVIIVNPNDAKVMSSGYIKDIGTTLGTLSFLLTVYLLLKK